MEFQRFIQSRRSASKPVELPLENTNQLTLAEFLEYLPRDLSETIRKCSEPEQKALRRKFIRLLEDVDGALCGRRRANTLSPEAESLAWTLVQVLKARKIQKSVRTFLKRIRGERRKLPSEPAPSTLVRGRQSILPSQAATLLQRWVRRLQVKARRAASAQILLQVLRKDRFLGFLRRLKDFQETRRVRAAAVIQRGWNTWSSYKTYKSTCAQKLQNAWRLRQDWQDRRRQILTAFATRIQACWRGKKVFKKFKVLRSTFIIQQWWKTTRGKAKFEKLQASGTPMQISGQHFCEDEGDLLFPLGAPSVKEDSLSCPQLATPPEKSRSSSQESLPEVSFDVSSFRRERKNLEVQVAEDPDQSFHFFGELPSLGPLRMLEPSPRDKINSLPPRGSETRDSFCPEENLQFPCKNLAQHEKSLNGRSSEDLERHRRSPQTSPPHLGQEREESAEEVALEAKFDRMVSANPAHSEDHWNEEDFGHETSEKESSQDLSFSVARTPRGSFLTRRFFKKKCGTRGFFRRPRMNFSLPQVGHGRVTSGSPSRRGGSMKNQGESHCSSQVFGAHEEPLWREYLFESEEEDIHKQVDSQAHDQIVSPFPAATIGCEFELRAPCRSFASDNSWASDPGVNSWAKVGWQGFHHLSKAVDTFLGVFVEEKKPGKPRSVEQPFI